MFWDVLIPTGTSSTYPRNSYAVYLLQMAAESLRLICIAEAARQS